MNQMITESQLSRLLTEIDIDEPITEKDVLNLIMRAVHKIERIKGQTHSITMVELQAAIDELLA